MLFLLVIGTLTLAFNIQSVKADDGTIYINADGSISPTTAPIYTADNITYTLTGNITAEADGIVIERDNIVLNGAGYTVTGSINGNGTTLMNMSNVTITNMTITNFNYGILLNSSFGNILSGNNLAANDYGGILLESSSGNTLSSNDITNNYGGILLESSSGNTLSSNNVTNGSYGISLDSSSGNILSGNNVTANGKYGIGFGIVLDGSPTNTLSSNVLGGDLWNFGVLGSALTDFLQSIDTSNFVDGEPVYYFINQSDLVVNADAYPEVGYLGFVNCINVTVQGMSLTGNLQGLLLAFTNDSKIAGNNAANNGEGIELDYSFGNALSGNNFTNNMVGIELYCSSGNTLSGNNVTANEWSGIGLGIELDSSSGNSIFHNNFIGNLKQVAPDNSVNTWDDGYPSGGNYWSDYNGTDTYNGPYQNLTGSDGIGDTPYVITVNNIDHYPLMNPHNASSLFFTISPGSATLDVGQSQLFTSIVTGGISPYTYQWCLNGSAVPGATSSSWTFTPTSAGSYTVYVEVNDSLGAQATSKNTTVTVNIGTHDVAVTRVTPYENWTYQGWSMNVNVTTTNLGDFTENETLGLNYSNAVTGGLIGTETVLLVPNETQTVTFMWDTAGVPYCYSGYNITAFADISPEIDSNMTNNVLQSPTNVVVRILGDMNGDGTVDILDAIMFANYFGLKAGEAGWNPAADMNQNGVTDILDAIIIAEHFGISSS